MEYQDQNLCYWPLSSMVRNTLPVEDLNGNLFLIRGSSDQSIEVVDFQKVMDALHFEHQYDWVDSVVTYYTNGSLSEEVTLMGYSDWVECVVTYHNNSKPYLASGSVDETIKI